MLSSFSAMLLTLASSSLAHIAIRSRRMPGMLLFALFIFVQPHAQAAPVGNLPPAVSAELENARIPAGAVSVWVQPVDAKQPVLALNAERPMNPASVMKVVTTFVALELLGPERIWKTRIATTGVLREDGALLGSVYLLGDGDPVLTYERLWRMLRRLRSLGFINIGGDIVLDHSALVMPAHDPYAFDGRGLRPYNSIGTGLLIHYNAQQLALFPGLRAQEAVKVVAEPPLSGVQIDNQLVTSIKSCEPWFRELDAKMDKGRLTLTGNLPASCGPRIWATSPLAPSDYSVAMVQSLWWELGGELRGKVKIGIAPKDVPVLFSDESVPLGEIVRTMNKWSSNIIARQLLAQVGRESSNLPAYADLANSSPDMVAAGNEAARRCLSLAGIETGGLQVDNGSGLSRDARIRADSLGTLLIRAWERPWMPDFIASLPVAGRDGTARRRLDDSPAVGYAHLKTGTINDVRAIAGYVLDKNGRRHAVVMMVNHPEAANSRKAQDALIEWVWSGVPAASGGKH